MRVSNVILEILKHLPGQHSQLKHAGTHATSVRVTQSDIKSDAAYADRILEAAGEIEPGGKKPWGDVAGENIGIYYWMLRRKTKGLPPLNHPYAKDYEDTYNEVRNSDMPQRADNWQKLFNSVADNAQRYYRGSQIADIKDLIKTGYIYPHNDINGNPDISMTLSPKVAGGYTSYLPQWHKEMEGFPEDFDDDPMQGLTLVIDANYARTHAGAKARDYTNINDDMYMSSEEVKEGDSMRGLKHFYVDDLEVQAFKPIPKEAILGVLTPDGNIKFRQNQIGRHNASLR